MKNVTHLGMEGSGLTKREAIKDAERKIELAMNGAYEPKLLSFGSLVVLIFRTPHGWCYKAGGVPALGGVCLLDSCVHGYEATRDDCERRARRHAAQILYRWPDSDGSYVILDPDDLADHQRWVEFQAAFAAKRHELINQGVALEQAWRQADLYARYGRHEGNWRTLGEGPFVTYELAARFAEAEVGVPYRITLGDKGWQIEVHSA